MPSFRSPGRRLRAALALSTILLASCGAALSPARFDGGTPALRPERFFEGETRSTGVIETAGGAPSQRMHVVGHGVVQADGSFRLDQTITLDGKPPTSRTWMMRRIDTHRYTATLTDAGGVVEAEAYGDLFHLTYPLKGVPFGRLEQWLYLQPDGCTVVNEGVARVAGVAVRRLSERISRVGAGCR